MNSPVDSSAGDNASQTPSQVSEPYRDVERIATSTKNVEKHYLKWRRHKSEGLSDYLTRLSLRGRMNPSLERKPSMIDNVLEKVAFPLGMRSWELSQKRSAAKARLFNDGYRYCCCTDVMRLATRFQADTKANMTLAELQESASPTKANAKRQGCLRCWFITECVMQFADHWNGVPPSEVIVNAGHREIVFGSGTVAVFTMFWVAPEDRTLEWINPKWSKLPIEIYYNEGGYPLYPNMKPRRPIPIEIDADFCVNRMREWMDECVSKHVFCTENTASTSLPTRLLDVGGPDDSGDVRLTNTADISDSQVDFAALTYCWGRPEDRTKSIPMTRKATLEKHLQNIAWTDLTPVFQDAVTLTRRLDLRYIWIDALCIIQDDDDDFAREASKMSLIYGDAHIVIAATRSYTGDFGLFRSRAEALTISHADSNGETLSMYTRRRIQHDDFITSEPRQFSATPLFARAWCFQERLLARRLIHFSEAELIFECKEQLQCECGGMISDNGLYHNFKVSCAYGLVKTEAKFRYQTWYSILRPYTARSLTFERDRLPALSGFARLLSTPEMGTYHAGMWAGELPSSLLWKVVRALPDNRSLHHHHHHQEDQMSIIIIDRPAQYRAPTWSWAGINAVIEGHFQFLTTIETVAVVKEVECTLVSTDPFGEVSAGHIVLEAPVVSAIIRPWSQASAAEVDPISNIMNVDQSGRKYTVSLPNAPPSSPEDAVVSFEADLHDLDVGETSGSIDAVCLAIEHDVRGTHWGGWSCLVLLRVRESDGEQKEENYQRIGIVVCPSGWFDESGCSEQKVVRII